ncbi:putative WW domain-containing protein [Phytophthora infestans]|uniref:WW domain-containing protein n=1 Tax=Phytophthora infestans TaxID=4787 RepID=A0A833T062_PHYIN|nr:putative WW domain-containing protein [Phytophthora infestans]KAF4141063.1 WW domain-containing protein [Phytophthora infestans]
MPPKSAVAADRLKKELAAQKARAEALKYLHSTGSGPSQRELSQQQQLRQKQTANATSSVAQRRVLGAQPEPSAADKFDPRVRDNTLHAVASRRAHELQNEHQIEQKMESYRLESKTTEQFNTSPPGWQEVVDPVSGDSYYWNETTNETVWERPGSVVRKKVETSKAKSAEDLADGWEEVPDAASGEAYYWNRKTNETTWTRPVARRVSLAQAIEAKAKLDSILKSCGNSLNTTTNAKEDAKVSNDSSNSSQTSNKRPAANQNSASLTTSQGHSNKRRKRDDGGIDPMDPTGTGGKWSDGLDHV